MLEILTQTSSISPEYALIIVLWRKRREAVQKIFKVLGHLIQACSPRITKKWVPCFRA